MKKVKPIFLIILSTLIATIAIPLAINESYKHGVVYVTKWDAADVLSYYGAIIGAVATIGALVITIRFTQGQISRDAYLKNENEKWTKIESVLADALNSINPMLPLIGTMDTGLKDPSAAITAIQKYQISCKLATDQLNAYLSTTDYPKVKGLIDAIYNFSEQISAICTNEIEWYTKLRDLLSRDTAKKTMDMENQYPGSFPVETLSFCLKIIHDTDDLKIKDIEDAIGQLTAKMVEAHQNTYRNLLQLKGSTFDAINTEIQRNADSILHLWGRKQCPHLNGSAKTK